MANPWDNDEIVTAAPAPAAASSRPPTAAVAAPAVSSAPAAPAANPWDGDEIVTPSPAPAQPQRSFGQRVARQVGLTARHAINGVAALPAMATDAVTGLANAALDATAGAGKGFRFQKSAQALDDTLTNMGLPTPETAQERVVGDATSALAGAGGMVKAGEVLAKSAAPVAKAIGNGLAADSGLQAASAMTSAGATGLTRESGGGEGGQLLVGLAGAIAPSAATAPFRRVVQASGSQVRDAARRANEAGYVIPPADLSPGPISSTLSAVSGKVKTAQEASARNQTVSNGLARKALGLGDDVDLNLDTLEGLRRTAAAAYEPVAASGVVVPGKSYNAALDRAVADFRKQAQSFPGAKVPEVVRDIDALRTAQFDAGDGMSMIRAMRESADRSYRSGENMAGKAYRQGAAALEDALEKHLQGLGQPAADILSNFRNARQTIARTYTVQGALNTETGAVNAIKLAADLAKNKPLTGDLRTIAEAARAFPKATQALKEAPKANSVLDVATVLGTGLATGSPLSIGLLAARPAARSVLLSRRMQDQAIRNAGTRMQPVPESAAAIGANATAQANPNGEAGKVYQNRLQAGDAARRSGGTVVPAPGGVFTVQLR